MGPASRADLELEIATLRWALGQRQAKSTELEARLTEALDRQGATSEILRVIASSPTAVQPVFDTSAHSVTWLCDGFGVIVLRVDASARRSDRADMLRLVAHHGACSR